MKAKKTACRTGANDYGKLIQVIETKEMRVKMYERATVFVPTSGRLAVSRHTSSSEFPYGLRLYHIP